MNNSEPNRWPVEEGPVHIISLFSTLDQRYTPVTCVFQPGLQCHIQQSKAEIYLRKSCDLDEVVQLQWKSTHIIFGQDDQPRPADTVYQTPAIIVSDDPMSVDVRFGKDTEHEYEYRGRVLLSPDDLTARRTPSPSPRRPRIRDEGYSSSISANTSRTVSPLPANRGEVEAPTNGGGGKSRTLPGTQGYQHYSGISILIHMGLRELVLGSVVFGILLGSFGIMCLEVSRR